jgi:acetyl-CoA carboxylase biotin carboxyl carrier protein
MTEGAPRSEATEAIIDDRPPMADDAAPAGASSVDVEAGVGQVDVPNDGGVAIDPADASLLALIDRLGALLDRSDLSELAVEAGGTRLVLRKPSALPSPFVGASLAGAAHDGGTAGAPGAPVPGSTPTSTGISGAADGAAPSRPSVKAPLTGVWYGSPAPGSAPFVAAGREVAVGQVVGLIEAMKLFNEIKSDLAGRVVRVVPESGALVKAKQPLIEVEPL